jgi:hypothetical protein
VLVACGGSSPPATHEEHSAEQEHAALPDAISRFHDVLAPLWHAEAGEARTERTCGSIDSLRARVEEVRTTPPPAAAEGDPAGWQVATDSLGQSVEELGTECAAEGRPAFEERLAAVHEAFHALAERAHGGAE